MKRPGQPRARPHNPGVLIINRNDSKCGGCGLGTDPHAFSHKTAIGYGPGFPRPGCGMIFEKVDSGYLGMGDRVRQMRPDLDPVGLAKEPEPDT